MSETSPQLLQVTAQIVTAYVGNNHVDGGALPDLLQTVYRTLATDLTGEATPASNEQKPAVPIKKSVFPDYLVCLEDGAKLKMLKRYIRVRYQMTPEQYREKWGLPPNYPMVAPNYSETRTKLAKKIGLGHKKPDGVQVTQVPEGKHGKVKPRHAEAA